MGKPYTSGFWTVIPGREEEFVAGWRALAQWAAEEFPGAGPPRLLRDLEKPNRFVSFGPWRDVDQITAFRNHPEFGRHVAAIRVLLEDFEPRTLEAVVEP